MARAIEADVPAYLTSEQARAARHVLGSPDAVIGIEGKAGTAKSHALAAVHNAAERGG